MIYVNVQSLGNPGSFDITDKDDPLYYIARAAHEESMQYYALQTTGFEYRQEEVSDVTTIQASLETYLSSFAAWLEDAVEAQAEGEEIDPLPTLPAIPGLPYLQLILPIILRIGGRLLEIWLRKKLDGTTDTSELVGVLRKALLHNPGEATEFPILEILAEEKTEIVINSTGSIEDMYWSNP